MAFTTVCFRSCCPWRGRARRRKIYSTERLTFSLGKRIFNLMVKLHAPLDPVFHALADATRRRMLRTLADGERTVGQLAAPFAMSLAAASKHLKALEQAGLVKREVRGREHWLRLDPGPLASAHEWLSFYERFWRGRLDILEELLREDDARTVGAREPSSGDPPAPSKGEDR